jgi:hypothetical protein
MAEEPNWDAIAEMHPVVDAMQRAGEKLTRENYIRNAYPDVSPEEWTAEHEAELPEPFQRAG